MTESPLGVIYSIIVYKQPFVNPIFTDDRIGFVLAAISLENRNSALLMTDSPLGVIYSIIVYKQPFVNPIL